MHLPQRRGFHPVAMTYVLIVIEKEFVTGRFLRQATDEANGCIRSMLTDVGPKSWLHRTDLIVRPEKPTTQIMPRRKLRNIIQLPFERTDLRFILDLSDIYTI
jgi:hypothetical protein